MDAAARLLLIKLLASWRDWPERRAWYLAQHIPMVIKAGPDAGRNLEERINLRLIRKHLNSEEWQALGPLVVQVDKRNSSSFKRSWMSRQPAASWLSVTTGKQSTSSQVPPRRTSRRSRMASRTLPA